MNPEAATPPALDFNSMNRKELRKWGKAMKLTSVPRERQNVGACAFCEKDVFVSDGQALKFYKGSPTHKPCRKALSA
jgi:hypothetical protein